MESTYKITQNDAKMLATKYKINLDVIPLDVWTYGLNVELEHGSTGGNLTNITSDDRDMTSKIAIAHLREFPDYYQRLKEMETSAETFWEGRTKPTIFSETVQLTGGGGCGYQNPAPAKYVFHKN